MTQSKNIAILASAGISAAFASFVLYNYLSSSRKVITSINSDSNVKKKNAGAANEYPKEIKEELTSRVKLFFGEEGLKKLENSFVIVVGLGGVGSHCANMLVRSGVTNIRLIDFDQVTLSSLNRHAVANMSDIGASKAEIMRQRLQGIVPWSSIEAYTEMFKGKDADRLLAGKPDYVVDCIDDINTKAELVAYCVKNDIAVLTSMGAGGKADPTRLRICSLEDCINDPLASKLKWKLKKLGVPASHVTSIFSVEKPVCSLQPLTEEQKQAPQDFGNVDYMRVRLIPVLGTSPSIFGQAMASYVLCQLAGQPYDPEGVERMSFKLKKKIKQVYTNNEIKRFKTDTAINVDDDDVEFIVQQIWHSRCAVTNRRFGGHISLTLTRWDPNQPPTPYNLVLMMQNEAATLAEKGPSAFTEEIQKKIMGRLAYAKTICEDSWDTLDGIDQTRQATVYKRVAIHKKQWQESRASSESFSQMWDRTAVSTVCALVSMAFSMGCALGAS